MKRYKKESGGNLEIGQVFYTKRFALTVDRALCKGCVLCKLVCPREAISLIPAAEIKGKAVAPRVDVDESKCDYHGICAVVCPFSAIKISVSGVEGAPAVKGIPAVEKGAFPTLSRDIEIDGSKCPSDCDICAEKCPLSIIEVKHGEKGADVAVKKELCAGCQICWEECPENAVKVTKFIEGSINIRQELCPKGCRKCLDVCPLNALYMDGGKVGANNNNCIYCGACQNVCPEPAALEITRTAVRHSPSVSGAWYKGLERITSAAGLNKELAAARADKARAAVNKLKGVPT